MNGTGIALGFALLGVALFGAGVSRTLAAPTTLELGSPFADDAILQRQMPLPVWGWAQPGERVTVTFAPRLGSGQAGQTQTATADHLGKWRVTLTPLTASSEPGVLSVHAEREGASLEVKGVLVGEVWLSSGQSNMDWVAAKSMCSGLANSLAKAGEDVPIREFHASAGSSVLPQYRVKGGWKRAKQAASFSALSLSFAHRLYEELGVPIGLLRSTHGATPLETWAPYEGFAAHPALQDIALRIRQSDPSTPDGKAAYAQFYNDLREWQAESEIIMNRGGKALPRPSLPGVASKWKGASRMFNKKINGFSPYAIRGMIWCQGANNFQDGRVYADKMEALANGIREVWGRPDLPFYFTQMQAYGGVDPDAVGYADLRQAQTLFFTRNIDKHVGMAVQHDMNSARPGGIHNFNKLHPGWRLARWALFHEYDRQDVAFTGPLYKSHTIDGDTVRVTFEQRGPGGALMVGSKGMAEDYQEKDKYVEPARPTPGDKLTHFRLAGVDGTWHAAEAVIDGMDVLVTSDAVPEPVGVQYAYSAVPMGANLYNEAGLPALSFCILNGKPVFQEDLRKPKPDAAPETKPARRPYVSVMTPFRNGVVVQRDRPAIIWGFALPGAKVTVQFAPRPGSGQAGQTKIAEANEFERWQVSLDPMPANAKGRDLVITTSDGAARTVRDVVVGDLWFLTGTRAFDRTVGNAGTLEDMPLVREFRARTKTRKSPSPRKRRMEVGGGRFLSKWRPAVAGENGMDISSVGYHFAQQVQQEGVPLGMITMGSENPPLTWISHEGLQTAKEFEAERDELNRVFPNTEAGKRAVTAYIDTVEAWCEAIREHRRKGEPIPPDLAERAPGFPTLPFSPWSEYTESATHTYNFVIAANTPLAVKGVVWLPERSNLGKDVARYAAALEAYAASLPETYGQTKLPFVYAQPSVALMRKDTDAETIRLPRIDGAASVTFDQWPGMEEIAAKLGALAADVE